MELIIIGAVFLSLPSIFTHGDRARDVRAVNYGYCISEISGGERYEQRAGRRRARRRRNRHGGKVKIAIGRVASYI